MDGAPVERPGSSPLRRVPTYARVGVLLLVLVIVSGFFHVVHGGGVGCTVIRKDGWALEDTFVDLDDYAGQPMLALLPKAKVVRALLRAGILRLPELTIAEADDAGWSPAARDPEPPAPVAPRWYCARSAELSKQISVVGSDVSICRDTLERCNDSRGDSPCVAEEKAACFRVTSEEDGEGQYCLTPIWNCERVRSWASKQKGLTFVGPCETDSAERPIAHVTSAAERAIGDLQVLKANACACKDAACADQVQATFDDFLARNAKTTGGQSEAENIAALAKDMTECLVRARE